MKTSFIASYRAVLLLPALLGIAVFTAPTQAQEQAALSARTVVAESVVTTTHKAKINGQSFTYKAYNGFLPVWDEEGNAIASVHYTYYERQGVKNQEERPIMYSFNGGPGSASVWMQIAYTGPKQINIDDEGYPIQPYGVKDNPFSVLDTTDIVFINPVNTGYSRVLPNKEGKLPSRDWQRDQFFGVNADVRYLAEWLNTFTTRYNRWRSPKFLIGESYGTTRVSGLALALQNSQWMYLNGVILVSPTDIGIDRQGPVKAANRLPYFAATAWYHGKLKPELQNKKLDELLTEVEAYALDTYLPALAKGAFLPAEERAQVAQQVAEYAGVSTSFVAQQNLDVATWTFWKELLRDEGYTVGRLDSRYKGIDKQDYGATPDFNAELTSWLHSFTPAINYYLREELGLKTDLKYNMFGPVHPWDRQNDKTGENLRQAMAQNPYLNVMVQSGYFDGATNYFDGKYNLWQLDPSGKMKDRMSYHAYESGHMMYLRHEDLKTANEHVRQFILDSLPKKGEPAKY